MHQNYHIVWVRLKLSCSNSPSMGIVACKTGEHNFCLEGERHEQEERGSEGQARWRGRVATEILGTNNRDEQRSVSDGDGGKLRRGAGIETGDGDGSGDDASESR